MEDTSALFGLPVTVTSWVLSELKKGGRYALSLYRRYPPSFRSWL
jgi:hypothetical protein